MKRTSFHFFSALIFLALFSDHAHSFSFRRKVQPPPPEVPASPAPPQNPPRPSPSPSVSISPVPSPSPQYPYLRVNIQSTRGFNKNDLISLQKAEDLLERVVNGDAFRKSVLNFTYKGAKQFVQNNGLSNAKILDAIYSGKEDLIGKVDHSIDLDLELYTENSDVVGYTYPDTLTIYQNTVFFRSYEPSEIANNMMHEWLHKIGFDHDFDYTSRRPYSVPYAIGDLVEELADSLK